jgi:serine/threonine protein kinase/Tfp pilus assembly protein PilF
MTAEHWDVLSAWLNEWLAADAPGRARLHARLADGHPELVAEAEALARASTGAQGFLETPALVLDASHLAAEEPWLPDGTLVGPYRITSVLARGGTGDVYRATDTRLDRDVALKVLAPNRSADRQRVERFMHEARVTASLDHRNIVRVYDVGRDGDHAWLVAELLEGETLRARIAGGALPVGDALRIALDITSGLAAAHAARLVHRDLKPENIFLTRDGTARILDFGIAKLAPEAGARGQVTTMTGVVLGTAGYLAPEQIRGAAVDARADLFALGTVLFEMLTGVRPFGREHLVETLHAILHDPPSGALAQRDDVPAPLVDVVMRLLEKAPGARFQSAREVTVALHAIDTLAPGTTFAAFVVQRREKSGSTPPLASPDVTPTASPDVKAEEKYLLGRVAVRRPTPEDLRNAERYFKEAIALDPDYADAWAGLASAYKRMPITGAAPARTAFEQARAAADRALALDPNNAEAISAQGTIAFWYEWDYERAETLLRLALTLQPDHADSLLFLAHVYSNTGRASEALDAIKRAQSRDQQWAQPRALKGQFLYMARRYDDALNYLDAVVTDIDPGTMTARLFQADTLAELGRIDEALAAYDRALTMQRHPFPMALRAVVLARSGRRAEAEAALAEVPAGFPYGRALALEAMDRGEEAMDELQAAIDARDPHVTFLGVDPRWDPARRRPTFRDVVRRVNLLDVSDRFVR